MHYDRPIRANVLAPREKEPEKPERPPMNMLLAVVDPERLEAMRALYVELGEVANGDLNRLPHMIAALRKCNDLFDDEKVVMPSGHKQKNTSEESRGS
jgi:hypothetical protein